MKKYKSLVFIFFWVFINFILFSVAYSCSYRWLIDECISANKSLTTKSIEDFVCIVWTQEEVTYQVIIDQEFKVLDDKLIYF